MKSQCHISRSLLRRAILGLAFPALCACSHLTAANEHSLEMNKVLEQINASLQAAAADNTTPSPAISSVQLDLQVGVSKSADVQLPINLVVLTGDVGNQAVHQMSLTFVPNPKATANGNSEMAEQFPGLTSAIRAIYQAGISSGSGYTLRNGSVKIECTFSADAGVGASVLGLVPLQLGGSYSNQTVQTITLNFGESDDQNNSSNSSIGSPSFGTGSHSGASPIPTVQPTQPGSGKK